MFKVLCLLVISIMSPEQAPAQTLERMSGYHIPVAPWASREPFEKGSKVLCIVYTELPPEQHLRFTIEELDEQGNVSDVRFGLKIRFRIKF